ncbi:MAG: carboxypeptidase-like regulatory domain-containing protein [Planctomycetota bacterium]|nr:carboxypeptidase-like regulatory domain-containing protein [Planctomycetota bacterium]
MSKRALSLSLILIILIGAGLSVFLLEPERESALSSRSGFPSSKVKEDQSKVTNNAESTLSRSSPVSESDKSRDKSDEKLANSSVSTPGLRSGRAEDSRRPGANPKEPRSANSAKNDAPHGDLESLEEDVTGLFSKTGLKGRFVTKSGGPAAGLSLLIWTSTGVEETEDAPIHAISSPHKKVMVGDDGSFQLLGMDPEKSYIFAVVGSEEYATAAFNAPVLMKNKVVDCGTLKARKAGVITGKIVNFQREAVPGAMVYIGDHHNSLPTSRHAWLEPEVGEFGSSPEYVALGPHIKVLEKGRFKITGLKEGQYSLVAERKGYRDGLSRNITIKEGEKVQGLEIELKSVARARIQVVNVNGEAIQGAYVGLRSAADRLDIPYYNYEFPETSAPKPKGKAAPPSGTDQRGCFTTGNLIENSYQVTVLAKGYSIYSGVHRLGSDAESHWLIKLERGRQLTGAVIDSESGKPLQGAFVTVRILKGSSTAFKGKIIQTTDSAGRFITTRLGHGRYSIDIQLNDYSKKILEVDVRESGLPHDLGKLLLSARSPVDFTVLSPSGAPIDSALIYMIDHSQRDLKKAVYVAKTGENGSGAGTVSPGVVTLRIEAEGYAYAALSKQTIFKKNNSLVIRLKKTNKVRGSVFGKHGESRPHSKLVFFGKGERVAFAKCVADGQGQYLIKTLPPGEYQVLLDSDDYRSNPASGFQLTVTEQPEVYADIRQVN